MVAYSTMLIGSAVAAIGLARFAPQHLLLGSQIVTFVSLYTVLTVSLFVWNVIIYTFLFSPLRNLPQPSGSSFIMGQFARIFKEPTGEPQREWMESIPNDGLIYYRFAFNAPRVLVTTPKGLAEVMTQRPYDFIKPVQVRRGLGRLLGVGVLLAEGDEHKRQRRSLNPAFAFRHVKNIYPVFWAKSQELVLAMDNAITQPATDGKPSNIIDVSKWASRSTLDIIGVAGFDKSFNAVQDDTNELYQTYQRVFRIDRRAQLIGLLNLVFPFWLMKRLPIQQNTNMNKAAAYVREVCFDLIRNKREKMAAGESDGVDILSVALKSGTFDDEDLVNQLMTFLAAGHETTASAMQWAILLLCQNPEIQKRLRKELLNSSLPSIREKGATITSEDVDNIPYLSAVCNEVLRYMPPVPFTLRQAAKDTTIQGLFVPKGTTVILAPQAINRNRALWGEDANDFKPDRWMGEGRANTGGADSNYAFMTFLHGPRSCIGSGFAKSEFAVLLASWIMAFDTQLEDPERKIEIQGGVTQRPKGGLLVKLTPVGAK